ncbi:hypothetical protein ACHAXA_004039 [Cyclostephanos tholiformis]|uniref:ubiquitinyl hydrolase 1 n=1 Tax=Cyclostephanos tholiformis TaxID=382380 RepID=A0ABD3R1K4_9STRA
MNSAAQQRQTRGSQHSPTPGSSSYHSTPDVIVPQTRLSDILSPFSAVEILGHDITRVFIRNFLRFSFLPLTTKPEQLISGGGGGRGSESMVGDGMRERRRFRYPHPLDQRESVEEREEIDLLLLGLSYDFSSARVKTHRANDNKEIGGADSGKLMKHKVAKAWSKLGYVPVPGYELDLTVELFDSNDSFSSSGSFIGGGTTSHSVESSFSSSPLSKPTKGNINNRPGRTNYGVQKSPFIANPSIVQQPRPLHSPPNVLPPPVVSSVGEIFARLWRQCQSVYGLDKSSFLRRGVIFPPTTVPERGPNGHMALMDCVFNALATTPPDPGSLMDEAVSAAAALTAVSAASRLAGTISCGAEGGGIPIGSKSSFGRSSQDDCIAQVLAAGQERPRILLPDLLIVFAICRLGEMEMKHRGHMEEMRMERERKDLRISSHFLDLNDDRNGSNYGIKLVREEDRGDFEEEEKKDVEYAGNQNTSHLAPPPRGDGILLACLLAFRVYDGYQRQNNLTRDTLQRFLSDVYGEESYKAPGVQVILDRLFAPDGAAMRELERELSNKVSAPLMLPARALKVINSDIFQLGVHATIGFLPNLVSTHSIIAESSSTSQDTHSNANVSHFSKMPSLIGSHILLDWILTLFNCMLPHQLPPPPKVCEHHMRIVNSDPLRMIDVLSTKYGLCDGNDDRGEGDNALYEIRRRFHSMEQHSITLSSGSGITIESIAGKSKESYKDSTAECELEAGSSGGAAYVSRETAVLLQLEGDEPLSESSSITPRRPKNAIDENSFVRAVSQPNIEMGHGGYLPPKLAQLTFRASAGRAQELRDLWRRNLWCEDDQVIEKNKNETMKERNKKTHGEEFYLSMYDVLSFGCDAVRYDAVKEDAENDAREGEMHIYHRQNYASEIPLMQLAFKIFRQVPCEECEASENEDNKQNMHANYDDALLTRPQIGKMLLLLLEHKSFRLEADSPPSPSGAGCNDTTTPSRLRKPFFRMIQSFEEGGEERGIELLDNDFGNMSTIFVDVNYASSLGLMPPTLDNSSPLDEGVYESTSPYSFPLSKFVDYVVSEANSGSKSDASSIDFQGFLRWHLHYKSSGGAVCALDTRLGPFLLDLQLIASVLFGVRPASAPMERILVEEIKRRHKLRYPRSLERSSQPYGPSGTIWYVISAEWWRAWQHFTESYPCDGITEGCYLMGKIDNNGLLSDEGFLSLKQGLILRRDFELLEPLAWSALQAWHDGGPPITREVVPFSSRSRTMSLSDVDEKYELELYPLFATVFLCDNASRGEPRPFQQFIPLSRYLPLEDFVCKLRESLRRGSKLMRSDCRLWLMDNTNITASRASPTSGEESDTLGWILDLDHTIVDERNLRGAELTKDENICLMLELRSDDGTWPHSKKIIESSEKDGQLDGICEEKEEMVLGDGVVGLYNLGSIILTTPFFINTRSNTCYLNSSIQCLSHTPILRDYFTSKSYLHDINATNPLGHEGRLAQAFAVLVHNLWKKYEKGNGSLTKNRIISSSTPLDAPALTPKSFKEAMGKFNESFAGNEQHDAQELLAFLLSGLSEDLNRIMKKPYIEAPDSDGRPDEELADIWWSNHLQRELSIIEALFTGQYKSTTTCRTCKYESARFEPFAYLQVPLPEDDQISVQCVHYPIKVEDDILKYSVRVRHDGTVNDLLVNLAKIIHANDEDHIEVDEPCGIKHTECEAFDCSDGNDKNAEKLRYAEMAESMAVVDMGESYIKKIIPYSWALSKLTTQESGEISLLHVYEIQPIPKQKNRLSEIQVIPPVKYSYLALCQRKLDFVPGPFLHPFQPCVFGSPVLLHVRDLEGYTGEDLYAHVSNRMRRYIPNALPKNNLTPSMFRGEVNNTEDDMPTSSVASWHPRRGRQHRQNTTADMEIFSAGKTPPFGFRLRLVSRDGGRCPLCNWFSCCVGCLIPCDDFPVIASCGDSIAIDWHMSVDLSGGGFGWDISKVENTYVDVQMSLHAKALMMVKKHSSFNGDRKKYGYSGSITLEECLDSFAKEEKIPEVFCSKCQDFRVQTKRMSIWRTPPLVMIHLKRFQFTQHMKRKLRDLVVFPIEGLDLSRIVAPSSSLKPNGVSHSKEKGDQEGHSDTNVANNFFSGTLHPLSRNNCGRVESIYDLYGVVHHQGALSGGHYVASLKSELDGKWRLFNDAHIYELNSRDVVDPSAYILFYVRRDVKGATLEDFWDAREREGEGLTEEEVAKLTKSRERCVIS